MSKLVFKTVVNNYGFNLQIFKTIVSNYSFNLKIFKTVITNYDFDDDKLVWVFLKKMYRLIFFLKCNIVGQNPLLWASNVCHKKKDFVKKIKQNERHGFMVWL